MRMYDQGFVLELTKKLRINETNLVYPSPEEVIQKMGILEEKHPEVVTSQTIGHSREGKAIKALIIGQDDKENIAATANCHAEEAVGTISLLVLADQLASNPFASKALETRRFLLIPQANPDGYYINQGWLQKQSPSYADFLLHSKRDLREEDVEHGIPTEETEGSARPESMAIAEFYRQFSAQGINYYVTLHSRDLGGGAMFLCGEQPQDQTVFDVLESVVKDNGMPMRQEDTCGLDGFTKLRDGFYSIPTFKQMREKFLISGHLERVKKFKLNSFEYVKMTCGTKLSLVSELPLFQVPVLDDISEIPGTTRYELKRTTLGIKKDSVIKFKQQLDSFSDLKFEGPEMNFAKSLAEWDLINIKGDMEDIQKVKKKTALALDNTTLKIQPTLSECKLNAILLRIVRDNPEHPQYLELSKRYKEGFDKAYGELLELLDIGTTSLKQQVRIQCGLVLAGLVI